jgi:hypothetical protein
MVTQ